MSLYKKGFSLIEVLLVIAILAIISSTITYGMIHQQRKARDARRKSDLNQVKVALEQAKLDCKGASYPFNAPNNSNYADFYGGVLTYLKAGEYLKADVWGPNGPFSAVDKYNMIIGTDNSGTCPDILPGTQYDIQGTNKFAIRAILENRDDPSLKQSFDECQGTYIMPLYELFNGNQPFKDDNGDHIDDNGFYYVCGD